MASSDPFAVYVTPGECGRVASRVELQYWRTHRPDTLTPVPFYRPVQREAVAAAQRCVARFTIARTQAADLLGLGQAYLGGEQLAQADSAFQRWLALLASQPGERRWALVHIVNAYLEARPAHLAQAAAYIERLDALGPSAAPERLMAHLAVMPLARHMDSVALQAAHLAAAIRASRELRGDTAVRYFGLSTRAYEWLADLYGRQGDVSRALRTLDSAEVELRGWCPPPMRFGIRDYFTRPAWGQPLPPLQVTRWFNDSTGGRRPTLGRPSLIFFTWDAECADVYCFARHAMLRRLLARYPDLDVVYVTATRGAHRTQWLQPEQEMELDRHYFFEERKLPGALAIWQTSFRRRAVDHGLEAQPDPNEAAYGTAMTNSRAVLVDRRGLVRMVYDFSADTEIRWRNVIGELP
jgi:tetratricopeptide (TPR) repeat protein